MIRFRAFRNGDPPALAQLWNRGLPDRGVVRPLSPHEFDGMAIGKLTFDREGLVVAEDEATGRVVGFAHAGFGPVEPLGPSHRLDLELGTVAMLVVDPDLDGPSLESGLFAEAEAYLRKRGAKVLYAGGQVELGAFYWGIYGGSECSGVLQSHESLHRAATAAGYEPAATTWLFEVDLSEPEPRDPRSLLIRRQVRVETVEDATPSGWWQALAIGHATLTEFRVHSRPDDRELARATAWDMAASCRVDGKARVGLIGVEVAPDERRKGYGRFLVGEILRHVRGQWGEVVALQAHSTNLPAIALYESLGFRKVDSATLYRKPGR